MSSLAVTIERLTIHEHPNADALELAQVGHYNAVVKKGQFKTGDYAIYLPEQAILPPELIEELGLANYLAGKDKNRVKAARLRGEVSQGVVCRPKALDHLWRADEHQLDDLRIIADDGTDFGEDLGITKWVPPIPVGMSGKVVSAPDLIRMIDIESIQRYPDIFAPGEEVVATEKIHGTCCLYTITVKDPFTDDMTVEEYVSSKGFGHGYLSLEFDERNTYWRAVRTYNLAEIATFIAGFFMSMKVGLFGEVYGAGVQDLHYGKNAGRNETLGYALFDVAYVKDGETVWASTDQLDEVMEMIALPRVPQLYRGPYDYELLAKLAEGRSTLHEGTIREGLVVRPVVERRSPILGGRAIGKIVSKGYLLRKGDVTEYE
jgi:RNA ligase (TIGR02306 family)